MKTLLSAAQVLRLAFPEGGYLPPDTLAEADIAAAEHRYLRPVLGAALHERLLAGEAADFTADYAAPCVALAVRLLVGRRLDLRSTRLGTLAPKSDRGAPPAEAPLCGRQRTLRLELHALLWRASEYLAAHPAEYPDYDPDANPLNRRTTDGGLVQVR